MTSRGGSPLLGLPVRSSGVRLGTVSAIWVGADRKVVGLEVTSAWAGDLRFLPAHAAAVENGAVTASAPSFLTPAAAAFYERNGARRITLPPSETRFRRRATGVRGRTQ